MEQSIIIDECVTKNVRKRDICTNNAFRRVCAWLPKVEVKCTHDGKTCALNDYHKQDVHKRIRYACYIGGELYAHEYALFVNMVKMGEYRWGSISKFFRVQYEEKMYAAACGGHIDIMKHFQENVKCINETCACRCFIGACQNGHMDIVKYLLTFEHSKVYPIKMCILETVSNGHSDLASFLHDMYPYIGRSCFKNCFAKACENGHADLAIHFMEYADDNTLDDAMMAACENGELDIVVILHENCGIPVNCEAAYEHDHIIEYATTHN